jgi:hypothetical protein
MRRPGWRRFWFAAPGSLQAGNKPAIPASEMRDDILHGPVTVHARLIHARSTNLIEQSFPLLILFLQPIQKFRFFINNSYKSTHSHLGRSAIALLRAQSEHAQQGVAYRARDFILSHLFIPCLPPPHQRRERQARRGIALPAGIPGNDQFLLGACDSHVEQAQALLHIVGARG